MKFDKSNNDKCNEQNQYNNLVLVKFIKLSFILIYHQDLVRYWCIQPRESPSNVHQSTLFDALTSRISVLKTFAYKHLKQFLKCIIATKPQY